MLEVIILTIIPSLTESEFEELLPIVSLEKQERIKKFHFFRDAQNSLLGDILARVEICRVTGLDNKQLEFSYNKYGKPYLVNDSHIHYNISHTGNYITCAISNEPIGIDIENINSIDLKIAERFFASDEIVYIMDKHQIQRFFEVWTKKESRIKWEGKGLSKPLDSFSVFDPSELEILTYYKVFQNDQVICHVCSSMKKEPTIRMIDNKTLMSYIKYI